MSDEEKDPNAEKTQGEATWEYKTRFGINDKISEVVQQTIKVAEAEIEGYRRKIEKLTYGS